MGFICMMAVKQFFVEHACLNKNEKINVCVIDTVAKAVWSMCCMVDITDEARCDLTVTCRLRSISSRAFLRKDSRLNE